MNTVSMRSLPFVFACCLTSSALCAGPPDGYLSTPGCGLAEPVGIGVSLPLAQARDAAFRVPRAGGRRIPHDLRIEEIEQRIGAWLDRKLRYPDRLSVRCSRTGDGWRSGHFERIAIEVVGGKLDIVPLAAGRLRLRNVDIDLARLFADGEVLIAGSAPAEAHLEVTAEGLNHVLSRKARRLRVETPCIELLDGQVHFSGRMRTLLIKNDVVTSGRFEIASGAKLNFFPSRLKVGYLPLPGAALGALARRFNPIVDLTRLKPLKGISFRLERVTVAPGRMILETANGSLIAKAP